MECRIVPSPQESQTNSVNMRDKVKLKAQLRESVASNRVSLVDLKFLLEHWAYLF